MSVPLLISAVGGNTPSRNFLDDRFFQTSFVFAEFLDSEAILPPHQIIFNTVSDADLTAPVFVTAQSVLALTTGRHFTRVDRTDDLPNVLSALPGGNLTYSI